MKKKIISLLLALIMTFAVSVPFMAGTYDALYEGIPPTTYRLVRMYHWVVRGQSLESIAEMWGTTVPLIRELNAAYFNDLANRNITTGLNIQVEPGVRLHIYDILTARHYVRRGDTLQSLANGVRVFPYSSGLTTTISRIQRENHHWFWQLGEINRTLGWNSPLVESFAMLSVEYNDFLLNVGPNARPNDTTFPAMYFGGAHISIPQIWIETVSAGSNSVGGAPLFISVPVVATMASEGTPGAGRAHFYSMTFYYPDREVNPAVGPDQVTSFHPWPTNPLLIGVMSGMTVEYHGPWYPAGLCTYYTFRLLNIPGKVGIFGR